MPDTTKCSAFRTFQGWTALSDMMIAGQGLLHVVPAPEAMAYILLRPLDDVPDDELCGAGSGRFCLVALRRDPFSRPGAKPAGLGKRDVHSRRAHV